MTTTIDAGVGIVCPKDEQVRSVGVVVGVEERLRLPTNFDGAQAVVVLGAIHDPELRKAHLTRGVQDGTVHTKCRFRSRVGTWDSWDT